MLLSDKVLSNEIFTLPIKLVKNWYFFLTVTLEKGRGGVVSEHEKFINFIYFFFEQLIISTEKSQVNFAKGSGNIDN